MGLAETLFSPYCRFTRRTFLITAGSEAFTFLPLRLPSLKPSMPAPHFLFLVADVALRTAADGG